MTFWHSATLAANWPDAASIYTSGDTAQNARTDAAIFKNIVRSFEGQLPLGEASNLVDAWEYLYERSVGCVGILKGVA